MSDTSFPTTAVAQEAERSIRSLYLDRLATAKITGEPWAVHAYHQAIDRSSLKTPVKNTLRAMVDAAGGRHTAVDRATVCLITGVRREATITAHWHQAREAGLLASKQRYDDSSLHTFLIPGTSYSADDVQWGEPLNGWHVWTADETAWWDSLDPGRWTEPPWHSGERPPF